MKRQILKIQNKFVAAGLLFLIGSIFFLTSCHQASQVTPQQAQKIAREAYIFAYPMLENYKTMYIQAIDRNNPDFKAPFNQMTHMTRLLDADFTEIVAPNNDTYYTFLWMDLRREPLVITVPPIPPERYFVLQFIDMFTHNFAYAGTRTTGNEGGSFLVAGPDWQGEIPPGIKKVFRSETQFVYMLGRILVNGAEDHDAALAILNQYQVKPLSEFVGSQPPAPAPQIQFPPYDEKKANSADFISYFNFLLQFVEPHPDDQHFYQEFAQIGIGKGKPFDRTKLDAKVLTAIEKGVQEGHQAIAEKSKSLGKMINGWSFIGPAFGSRKHLQDKILVRAAAAMLGMYGNSMEEAANFSCMLDAEGKPLNAANGQKYIIRFPKGKTPPVHAFWSITMYRLPEVLFVHNPINRYSISDRTPGIQFDRDGSLTIYIQHQPPAKNKISNWLPAPDGPFMLGLRIYYPKQEVLTGEWKPPYVQKIQ